MNNIKHTHTKQYSSYRVLLFVCVVFCSLLITPQQTFAQKKLKSRKDSVEFDSKREKFNDTFSKANLLKNKKDYNEALDLYYNCVKLFPRNSVPYYEIAQIYLKQWKRSESEKAIKKAIKINPNQVDYYYFLADLYKSWRKPKERIATLLLIADLYPDNLELQYIIAEVYTENKQFDSALQLLDKLEKKYGVNEKILEQKIINYSLTYNQKATENELIRIIELFPLSTKNHYILAEFYTSLKEYSKALDIYTNLLEIEDNSGEALLGIGNIYLQQEEFDKLRLHIYKIFSSPFIGPKQKRNAYDDFVKGAPTSSSVYKDRFIIAQELLNYYPDDVGLHTIVANYFYKIDSLKFKSLPHYYYALEHKDADIQTYKRIIILEKEQVGWDSVISVGKQVIEAYPYYKNAYIDVAEAYITTNKYALADTFLIDGSDLVFRKNVKSQFNSLLAYSSFKQSKKDLALDYLQKAGSYDSTHYVYNQVYAYIHSVELTQQDRALQSVNYCINEDSTDITNSIILARLYFNTAKYLEAETVLQNVVRLKPTAESLELLGDILYKKGEIAQAKTAWNSALDFGAIIDIKGKELLLQKK